MIHYSFVEGFSFCPSSGLLILGVEGYVTFEELDLKLHLTPMVFVLVKNYEIWVHERRRYGENEKNREKEAIPFPFILWVITLLPLKRAV